MDQINWRDEDYAHMSTIKIMTNNQLSNIQTNKQLKTITDVFV